MLETMWSYLVVSTRFEGSEGKKIGAELGLEHIYNTFTNICLIYNTEF